MRPASMWTVCSKYPLTYQGFDPAEVGREHRIVLGKHSGIGRA